MTKTSDDFKQNNLRHDNNSHSFHLKHFQLKKDHPKPSKSMNGLQQPSRQKIELKEDISERRRDFQMMPSMMMMRYPLFRMPYRQMESRNCRLNPDATHELKTKLFSSPTGFGTKIVLSECKSNIERLQMKSYSEKYSSASLMD